MEGGRPTRMNRIRLVVGSHMPTAPRTSARIQARSTRIEVVARVHLAADLLRRTAALRPQAVLVDTDLFGLGKASLPGGAAATGARSLLFCLHADDASANGTHVLASACVFVLDRFDLDAVAQVIDTQHASRCPYTEPLRPARVEEALRDSLTDREREILAYVAREMTSREIGGVLGISHRTVDAHRANVMKKLNIHSIAGLVRYAFERGILDRGAPT